MSNKKTKQDARRTFLKKVVYKAPIVVGLGMLIKAEDAQAGIGHNSKVQRKP